VSLVLSYVLDWIIIIAAAGVGAVFSSIKPNMRPFTLTNAEISFPHVEKEKISTVLLGIVAFAAPAGIILLMCLLLVPGPTVSKATPKALVWRRKLWEWHTGWLGLALALAAAFLITNGMKNLFGKPRPDLLSRCQPDVTHIANYTVGGFPNALEGYQVVSAAICQQTDTSILYDGFRSFPSGHSSFSAAGLIYLSLFIASKLAITIPFLAPSLYSQDGSRYSAFPSRAEKSAIDEQQSEQLKQGTMQGDSHRELPGYINTTVAARNQAAAPPVYLLVFAVIPFFSSIYIASTRYSDFRHHGFDILFGYLIGTTTAIFSFRYYHLPISQGAGWSWGPRSRDRSFWAGVGVGSYVGTSAVSTIKAEDMETGVADRQVTNEVGAVNQEGRIEP
jgi:membrane-associated phospholipid phosphatase